MFAHWKKNIKYYVLSIMGFLCIIHATNYLLPTAYAQTTSPNASPSASTIPYTLTPIPSTISPTSPLYTDLLLNNIFHTFSCLSIGQSSIGQPCLSYQKGVPILSQDNTSGGLLGITGNLIAALYSNPPIRTSEYLASVGQNLGLVKEARAQVVGSGFEVLNPVLNLWQVSRNVAYLIMIIIFLVIGLMVMFRNRINPQTVITAQASLPGLVIGLILITFSYFLASLLTDLSFIGTDLVGYYFSLVKPDVSTPVAGAIPPYNNNSLTERAKNDSGVSIFSDMIDKQEYGDYTEAATAIVSHLKDRGNFSFFPPNPRGIVNWGAAFINMQYTQLLGPLAAGPFGAICLLGGGFALAGACATAASIVVPIIANTAGGVYGLVDAGGSLGTALFIIAIIVLIFSMIRLMIRLIQNYLAIIFATITAPFTFLAASLPGRQGLATNWILNMLCNILSFPAVMAVFYFVAYLLGPDAPSNTHPTISNLFGINSSANIAGPHSLPLFGGLSTSLIKTLLSFGALIATPAVPEIICKAIGRLGPAGELIGREYSQASGQGQGYIGRAQQGMDAAGRSYGRASEFGDKKGWKLVGGNWVPSDEAIHGASAGAGTRLKKGFGF